MACGLACADGGLAMYDLPSCTTVIVVPEMREGKEEEKANASIAEASTTGSVVLASEASAAELSKASGYLCLASTTVTGAVLFLHALGGWWRPTSGDTENKTTSQTSLFDLAVQQCLARNASHREPMQRMLMGRRSHVAGGESSSPVENT